MKKLIILYAVIMLLPACKNNKAETPTFDVAKEFEEFSELTVGLGKSVSPTNIEKTVVINDEKEVYLYEKHYEDEAGLVKECYGHAKMEDQDFENLVVTITTVNLIGYTPIGVDDPACTESVGVSGVTITYLRNDNTYNQFYTICEEDIGSDAKLDDLLDAVDLAISEIETSCYGVTVEEDTDTEEGETQEGETEAEEEQS